MILLGPRIVDGVSDWIASRRRRKTGSTHFRGYLNDARAGRLATQISNALKLLVTANDVQRIVRVFLRIEDNITGRIAGDVDDYILNYYMLQSTAFLGRGDNIGHLEIGVLFGGSLVLMATALRNVQSSHWAIGLDPLDGYYGLQHDPATGLPVTLETAQDNLRRNGFAAARVRIVRDRSESPEAIAQMGRYRLATLWIDGDHSYEGVKRDWENYSPLVVPGGYVLFDNYNDTGWPGVSEFVDKELLPNLAGFQVMMKVGRSILLQRDAAQ